MQELFQVEAGNNGNLLADRVMRAKKRPTSASAEEAGKKSHQWSLKVDLTCTYTCCLVRQIDGDQITDMPLS